MRLLVLLFLLLFSISTFQVEAEENKQGILDQHQTYSNGGMSARTLKGCSLWQSFTSSKTGKLTHIDLKFFGKMNGFGKFTIFEGEGLKGKKLYTSKVTVKATDNNECWNRYKIKARVIKGKKYTFHFVPDDQTLDLLTAKTRISRALNCGRYIFF